MFWFLKITFFVYLLVPPKYFFDVKFVKIWLFFVKIGLDTRARSSVETVTCCIQLKHDEGKF